MSGDETERLARLEREMALMRIELARLRENIGAAAVREPSAHAAVGSSVETPGLPGMVRRTPWPPPKAQPKIDVSPPIVKAEAEDGRSGSIEEVVGRYATIGVATLTVLIGVGIFLNWAIENSLLGPRTRVVLGYMGAMTLASIGIWLRIRGTREFGNVLLAMALGVVHLVSWSAGPLLHVIPSWAALGVGTLASVILAEFALRHDEETLCAIGFGGAAVAPFVLSDTAGSRVALAIYGLLVVALSAAALRRRSWKVARHVTVATLFFYTLTTGIGQPENSPPAWIAERLWILFPLAAMLALIPLSPAPHRRALLHASAVALILGAGISALEYRGNAWALALTAFGAIVYIVVMHKTRAVESEIDPTSEAARTESDRDFSATPLLEAFVMPVGLFLATVVSTPIFVSYQGAIVAVAWFVGLIAITHASRAEREADFYAAAASFIALWIVPAAFLRDELFRVAASALLGIALMLVAMRMNRKPFVVASLGTLIAASVWALFSMRWLPPYEYTPFMTRETLACVAAVAGWLGTATAVARDKSWIGLDAETREWMRQGFFGAGVVTAFGWGVGELQGAWNETASTALLIMYYAATGTLMIWLGRTRQVKALRVIGLGLSLWAALKAVKEAFFIPNVAVRIAVFFVVSAFLIAVGYWYRSGAEDQVEDVPPS